MKFLLTVFPGLSTLAAEELQGRLKLAPVAKERVRGSELLWVQTTDPSGLLELRLPEDVFVEIENVKLAGDLADLRLITKTLARAGVLAAAVRVYEHLARRTMSQRVVFRVVAQADDADWRKYRRVDMQTAAEAGIGRACPGWRLDSQEAPVEIWLHQVDRMLGVSLRLTSGVYRARGGRAVEREAALRPTIAAAMVQVAGPGEDDVFLDPMCGSGTLLLERAVAGRYGLLLGGDIEAAAVKATLANFGPRHQPRRIERMDARRLPLEDSSVDKFVTNLPWGRQIGRAEELPALYAGVLAEAVRVVRIGGAIVLLTSDWSLLKRILKDARGLKLVRTISNIEVLGRRADMFVLTRI
jgi:23S rRNA G2445 N2-methylase RlmL